MVYCTHNCTHHYQNVISSFYSFCGKFKEIPSKCFWKIVRMEWMWVHSNFWPCHTRKYCFDVPRCSGVNEGVHIKHDYRHSEAVWVSFHRAGVEVVPLDPHTLLFILREILTAKAKGHRWQETLRKQVQTLNLVTKLCAFYLIRIHFGTLRSHCLCNDASGRQWKNIIWLNL